MKISTLTAEIRLKNNIGDFLDGLVDILQEFECSDDLGRRIIALVNENVIVDVDKPNREVEIEGLRIMQDNIRDGLADVNDVLYLNHIIGILNEDNS